MKTKLYGLIRGLRLSVSIPAGLLVHIGSKLDGIETNWLLAITLSTISGLTMLTNDYFDRYHDRIKRKYFAWENDKLVNKFLLISWSLVFIIVLLFLPSKIPILVICGLCILYSFTLRKYPLPILLVVFISAMTVLLPNLGKNNSESIDLFITLMIAIFGREILKDAEDKDYDVGHKKTFFTESDQGEYNSWIRIAGFCFVIVAGKVLTLSVDMGLIGSSLCVTGAECILASGLILFFTRKIPKKFK